MRVLKKYFSLSQSSPSSYRQEFLIPKLSDFFTPHKGGGEVEKPFRAITFGWLNQPWGLFNHHLFGESLRSIAQTFNISHSKRV
jgi:hypothetical protein